MTRSIPVFPKVILATFVAIGFGAVWGLIGVWIWDAAERLFFPRQVELLRLQPDGSILIQSYSTDRYQWSYRDLEGNEVDVPDDKPGVSWLHISAKDSLEFVNGGNDWQNRILSFSDYGKPPIYWYLLLDGRSNGHAYMVGYDSVTKALVGYMGTAGFRAGALPADERFPFDGSLWGRVATTHGLPSGTAYPAYQYGPASAEGILPFSVFIQTSDGNVYEVDLKQRTVRVILADPRLQSIGMAQMPGKSPAGLLQPAIRLEDRIQVLNGERKVAQEFLIPPDLRSQTFRWAALSPKESVFTTERTDPFGREALNQFFWVNSNGAIERQSEVSIRSNSTLQGTSWLVGCLVPSPLFVDLGVCLGAGLEAIRGGRAAGWSDILAQWLGALWPSLLLAQMIGAWCAWLCYKRQSQYGASSRDRLIWPAFVFLMGLPGWIGYRYCRSWPTLERCPDCGATVPRDRPECVRCRADFPAPALKGTEVFA